MKIVVDMLGGDLGLVASKNALINFIKEHSDVSIFAVGPINELNELKDNVKIIDANKVMKMDAHAMEILHDKESSMAKAIMTLIDNDADAIVSAGGTGALLTLASLRIKKLDGVIRPALISPIPTLKENKKSLLLDLGANNENSVDELIGFIKMSKIYYQSVYDKEANFALLSNGTEEGKGSPLILETKEKINELNIVGFKGNIEASDILKGEADIIVTDGFTGNVALKAIEGTGNVVKSLLKDAFSSSIKNKIAYLLVRKKLKEKMNMLSSKPLGGAMFIGVKKVVVKAHGNSDEIAFKNAIETAYKCVKSDLINKINKGLNNEK